MIQFICYFFPAFIAVWITEKNSNQIFNLKEFIYHLIFFTILINFSIFAFIYMFFHPETVYLSMMEFTYSFTIKYLSIALILSFILPFIYHILVHNLSFSVTVEEERRRGRKPGIKKEELKDEKSKKTKIKK